jgi:tricorn protease interacting factor F2/3
MSIKPENYNLSFEPDLNASVFKGSEVLNFSAEKEIDAIILDSQELKITSCEFIGERTAKVKNFSVDEKEGKLNIELENAVMPGKYRLKINFEGLLSNKFAGFYRSTYSENGKEKYFATTMFEAADAKRAFPCVDHPLYKATFDIQIVVAKGLQAVSNTLPIEEKKLENDGKIFKFATTPKMSTYLLYLGIGEFGFLDSHHNNTLIRAVGVAGKEKYGAFAIEVAKKCLDYYEDYFGVPYPLPKLDLIAVPDFAMGAMENWGAIAFRETAMLYYDGETSQSGKQRIAETVAHEIAHMWFGNLVTMKWWDDLWLNESFATFMSYKLLNRYWPEWDVWSKYIQEKFFEGMDIDSLKSSHPIKVVVNHTSEIDELFDAIAYEKGGSILRMIENYLGEEVFGQGLKNYIEKFKYTNAEAKDLWVSLEEAAKKPVAEIIQSFILQIGYPIIKAELIGDNLKLSQERFLREGPPPEKTKWQIPLVIQYGASDKKIIRHILKESEEIIPLPEKPKFININYEYCGFFIADYSNNLLKIFGENINLVSNKDKLGIIHDLSYLVYSDRKDLSAFLDFADSYLAAEIDPVVLRYLIDKLYGFAVMLENEFAKKLAVKFSAKAIGRVGYEPKISESVLDSFLRVSAISALSMFENQNARDFVINKFKRLLKNKKNLHPDIRGLIYAEAVWADEKNYIKALGLYRTAETEEEKVSLLSALANVKNKTLIRKTLDFSLTREVRFTNIFYVMSRVSNNPIAGNVALEWLFKNWDEAHKRAGGLGAPISKRIIEYIIPECGISRETEIRSFFDKKDMRGLEKTLSQVLERLKINTRLVEKYKKS